MFRNLADTEPVPCLLSEFAEMVSSGEFADAVASVRAQTTKPQRDAAKRRLPVVAMSGVFAGGHGVANLKTHSGLICIDFDASDNPNLESCADQWRDKLAQDEFVRLAFISASGNGVAVVCRIEGERHGDAFDALTAYFRGEHGLVADKACRDVSRLRFMSWDDQAKENKDARLFKRYSIASEAKQAAPEPLLNLSLTMSRERRAEIESALEFVSPDTRETWLTVGMAIQSESPHMEGFNLWRAWSELNDCAGKFDAKDLLRVWNSLGKRDGITAATVFQLAKAGGWGGAPKSGMQFDNTLPVLRGSQWIQVVPPVPDMLLDGLFCSREYGELIAPSKCRKSFFALQLAMCLASGRKFLQWAVPRKRRTHLFNLELDETWLLRRMRAMGGGLGVQPDELDELLVSNLRGFNLRDPIDSIRQAIHANKPDLAIIDPMYLVHGEDESDQKAMTSVFRKLSNITKEEGTALLVVHHDAKGKAGDRDKRDRGSGSGVMGRASDMRLLLTPHADDPDNLTCCDVMGRNFPGMQSFTLEFSNGFFLTKEDVAPEPETSRPRGRSRVAKAEKIAASVGAALDMIRSSPVLVRIGTVGEWLPTVGCRSSEDVYEVKKTLKAMCETGKDKPEDIHGFSGKRKEFFFYGPACDPEQVKAFRHPGFNDN